MVNQEKVLQILRFYYEVRGNKIMYATWLAQCLTQSTCSIKNSDDDDGDDTIIDRLLGAKDFQV